MVPGLILLIIVGLLLVIALNVSRKQFGKKDDDFINHVKKGSINDLGINSNPAAYNINYSADVRFDNLAELILFEKLINTLKDNVSDKETKKILDKYSKKFDLKHQDILNNINKKL